MALVNQAKREINAKIVYFGPGLAGKSTNLKHIYGKLKPEFRGNLKGMQVKDARMLFFDFTPPGDSSVHGFKVRFHVYTLTGEPADASAWKMVLKGVDGVVFVADSAIDRLSANRESMQQMASYLEGYGLSLSTLPALIQYNKRDLPDALPVSDLDRLLNPFGKQTFEAQSQQGDGVLQTLLTLVKGVLLDLRRKGLEGIAGPEALSGMVEAPAPPQPEPEVEPEPEEEFEEEPLPPLSAAPEEEASLDELSVEFAGTPQLSGGRLSLPLVIRAGERSKTVTLQLTVSLD